MRLLFLTGTPARYMAPPRLAEDQVVAGPDWSDEQDARGRWVSMRTPMGEYDVADVIARFPPDQRPDAVACLVDASWRNQPRNLKSFAGPSALLIADTHHLSSPLIGMLKYAAHECFDRLVLLYDRHHADIFLSAGLQNLHWLPGLTFPHDDATVLAVRRARRVQRIAFVGQAGKFHPRRAHLLEALRLCGLPVDQRSLAQKPGLAHYGASLLGFNASLNGDLNLRAFEILASGAALLTDRLAPASGFDLLWQEGREALTYRNADDLAAVAERALADPEQTARIGAAGAAWFDAHFNAARRRDLFQSVILRGENAPEFQLRAETTTVFFPGNIDRLLEATMVYEGLQELHRQQETVRVALGGCVPADVAALCATLPRIETAPASAARAPDMLVFSRAAADITMETAAQRLWCCDAQVADFPVLAEGLAPAGYKLVSEEVAVLCRAAQVPGAADSSPGHTSDAPRVLIYTDDPDSGGVAQYNHSLIMGLVAAGYSVSCAQSQCESPLVAAQRSVGVLHHWIPFDTKREFGRTVTDKADARRIYALARPELVIFSDCCPMSNLAARQVALESNLPFVCVVGFVGAYLADRFKQLLPMLSAHYAAARAVVAVSQENLDLLRQRFGLAAGAGQVIHYGRPSRFFAPRDLAVRKRLRAELELADDAVVCFTAARLAPVKGHHYLIAAAKRLLAEPAGEAFHFVWAGEGEQRVELARTFADAGIASHVHLLGHRWDMADWYDAADIFVLPSDMEGMPLAIMEAMAKGLPVAATAVSGIPEQLGDTGQLLSPGFKDRAGLVDQLVRTLRLWSGDAALRARIGAAGKLRADALFRETLMVERTVSLIGRHVGSAASVLSA